MNKKQISYIVIAAVIVIAVVFVGRGMSVGFTKKGVLERAFADVLQAETLHVKADLDMNLALTPQESSEMPFTTAVISVEGDVKYNEDAIPELKGSLYMESRGRGNVLFVDGDARIFSDQVAFRLDNLPTLMKNSIALVDKWTYVDAPVLATKNKEEVKGAFREVFESVEYIGQETLESGVAYRYSGDIPAEHKERLANAAHYQNSGNQALHVLARLLKHNEVHTFDIWVDKKSRELALVRTRFVRPLQGGSEADFGTLKLSFTEYGKKVDIDRPEIELTVRPDVFSRLFGDGQMDLQAVN